MAKGQAKKVPVKVQAKVQPKAKTEVQADNMVFSLDIGTRSIIAMVGVVVEDKVKIIAIEKEEHNERAMIDGQIENIEKVSALAKKVKKRLEDKVHTKLKRVSVAAAGRALRTSRVDYEMVLQGPQVIDDEVINRLEAGAISKAEAQFDETQAKKLEQKMKKAEFDFNDYLEQMDQIKKMGGLSDMLSMLPGFGSKMKNIDIDEKALDRTKSIIYSMTPAERSNPDVINPSRKKRIAAGAGVDISEVNRLIKQHEQSRKMMKQMSGMMGKAGKKGRFKLPF